MIDLAQNIKKENKSFCSMAWTHQFLDPTGRVKPCCRFEEKYRPEENSLSQNSLSAIFKGPWMNSVREKMLIGVPVEGCIRCYQEEAAGKKSLRQRYNTSAALPMDQLVDLNQPEIKWIELAISNQCNLACRMCDSRYSWKWFDEEQENFNKTFSQTKFSKINIEEVFPFVPHLVHIKFTGGEPLITPSHWNLIDKLLADRDCSEIFLNYSTNCTIKPQEKWIEKWRSFKFVEFALSFDSINPEEAEYIRWPAKFDHIQDTTKEFIKLSASENIEVILRTTVSLLNIWSLPETIQWWEEKVQSATINPTHLTHPNFLSVTVLPKQIKERITEKFSSYLNGNYSKHLKQSLLYMQNHMWSKDNSLSLSELKTYLEKTDEYRKQNFYESYPQFYDIFNGY